MTSPNSLALTAVEGWLEDGIEFCYISEQDEAFSASEDDLDQALVIADGLVQSLLNRLRAEDM